MKDPAEVRESVLRVVERLGNQPPAVRPDVSARAVWFGGLQVRLAMDKPPAWSTDMPAALGGEDTAPSPGWYLRAGAASCLATTIALHAARQGIALRRLEVEAHSESDPRGLLGCADGVPAGPQRMWLEVAIEADGADVSALQELLAYADAHAPVSTALRQPLAVRTTLQAAAAAQA